LTREKLSVPRYAELHCLTNFSFLRAASHPDELVARAAELGYAALAITDRHSLAGVVEAHAAAQQLGLKLLIGAEVHPVDAPAAVLLATDRAAYARLARLLTYGKSQAAKGDCRLAFADLAQHGAGLVACPFGNVASQQTPHAAINARSLALYREAFNGRAYLLAETHQGPNDEAWFAELQGLSKQSDIPIVAAGGVYYHAAERRPLQDVLTAIRLGRPVAECGRELFANAERHLRPLEELEWLYEKLPGALRRSQEVADRCLFSLDELKYEYPEELVPLGIAPIDHLCRLTREGAVRRYPNGVPEKVVALIERELRLIEQLGYEAYFLTVWDLVRFARERDILCQGRGSAANSAVCYCLGVTSVDPDRIDVLFERFISVERNEPPDIDVDFEHERREEVLQYVYEKYGRERAAMTAVTIRYRSRSASREVGKALGLPEERIEALAKTFVDHHRNPETKWIECCRDGGLDPGDTLTRQFITLAGELVGFPRHLSQHVGGMVISRRPLCEMVPIENAAMPGRTVIEWNKDDLDALGLLKVDCLSLGMLTAIRKCFQLIQQTGGPSLTLATVPAEDPAVYEMISSADTMGVFQIESRAQMSMLPRLRPQEFYDLVIEVAIVRPGPIQGNMVHPYLRRRAKQEPVEYANDEIRRVLHKTLGVPIFQEQAMQLAIVAAGFTPGEADQLRRAMAAWRRTGSLRRFREKLIEGMKAREIGEEFAERLYQQICGFGEYGFPESHAASFALLVYVSAWLKRHHPAAFCAALLNSQPMGFYAPAQLIRNAREHGVEVRPADVNHSDWDLTLEPGREHGVSAVRLGFRLLQGLPEAAARRILAARQDGPFRSPADLARRADLGRPWLTLLARADALQSLAEDRRSALWQALAERRDRPQPLFAGLADAVPASAPRIPLTEFEEVLADYRTTGLTLRAHPMSFIRGKLTQRDCLTAAQLAERNNDSLIRTAGLVLLRQRPGTAKGITFVTLEDETGVINLIVKADVWQRYRAVARSSGVWLVDGRLQKVQPDSTRKDLLIHVVAARLVDLSREVGSPAIRSRDFH